MPLMGFSAKPELGGLGVETHNLISAIKIPTNCYEERLRIVKSATRETVRLRRGLLKVFEIFSCFEDLDTETFVDLSRANTRSKSFEKLIKPRCRPDTRECSIGIVL